jgi:hypothetical protein
MVVSAVDEDLSPLSPEALIETCHEILEAASVLLVNVELLESNRVGDRQDVVDDARLGIRRLAKTVLSLQAAARCAKAGRVAA